MALRCRSIEDDEYVYHDDDKCEPTTTCSNVSQSELETWPEIAVRGECLLISPIQKSSYSPCGYYEDQQGKYPSIRKARRSLNLKMNPVIKSNKRRRRHSFSVKDKTVSRPTFDMLGSLLLIMCSKLKASEEKNRELTTLVSKQKKKLQKFSEKTIHLAERFKENKQQLELQRNELKEQQITLQEMQVLVAEKQQRPILFNFPEGSKPLWIFRKYQRNLVVVSRPHIQKIIEEAVKAGLVLSIIGVCAQNCVVDHDCVDGFYKALLVTIAESPDALEEFLRMVLDTLSFSTSVHQLCTKILLEVHS